MASNMGYRPSRIEITELQICRCTGIETVTEIEPINVQIRVSVGGSTIRPPVRIFSPEIDCNETVDQLNETCIPLRTPSPTAEWRLWIILRQNAEIEIKIFPEPVCC